MSIRLVLSSVLSILPIAAAVSAQERPPDDPDIPKPSPEFMRMDREVGQLARRLGDWSQQQEIIDGVIRNVWEQNGWDNESDLFARDTALEISKIPVWQLGQRMSKLTETIDSRYQLNDKQRDNMRRMIYREFFGMTTKYGPQMLGNFREVLDTRLQNKPFTPDQIARWEKAMDPLIGDWQKDVERITDEFGELLTPEQKMIFDRDKESAYKRLDYYLTSREAWKRGEWSASDWGLQDDPVQMGKLQPSTGPSDAVSEAAVQSWEESSWEAYVRAFIDYYQLDRSQEAKCMTILDRLVEQARSYRQRHAAELAEVSRARAESSEVYEPIRMLFLELKSRLDQIPTDSQVRSAAERHANQRSMPPDGRTPRDDRPAPKRPRGGS